MCTPRLYAFSQVVRVILQQEKYVNWRARSVKKSQAKLSGCFGMQTGFGPTMTAAP